MLNEFTRTCFPSIAEAIDWADAHPHTVLNDLDWSAIASELPLLYTCRNGQWDLEDDNTFSIGPIDSDDDDDDDNIEDMIFGLYTFIGGSDNPETTERLVVAASRHILLLRDAVHPSMRDNWLEMLTAVLVESASYMTYELDKLYIDDVIRPHIYEQIRSDILAHIDEAFSRVKTNLPKIKHDDIPAPPHSRTQVWDLITYKAHNSGVAIEVNTELRMLCRSATAGNLCERLAILHSQGYINLSGLTIKQTYDALSLFYNPLPYSYANFKQYYKPKK